MGNLVYNPLSETPTVHHAPVEIKPLPCFRILKWIVRSDLSRRNEAGNETGLLAVDQSMGATVPSSPLALNEAKQMDQKGHVRHIVHDVLKPPLLDDLAFIDAADRVGGHQAWLVRSTRPRLSSDN